MSTYKLETFVREAKPTDNLVTIYDNKGLPTYTVNPLSITRILVQKNFVKLTTNKNVLINLDFVDDREARLALVELQKQFDIIKRRIISQADAKAQAVEIVQTGTDFTQLYDEIISGGTQSGGTQSGGTQSGGTQSGGTQNTIESRIINLVRNISQDINVINQNVNKIDTGPDFIQLYESKKTGYNPTPATYSNDNSLTEKISSLVQYIAQDFYKAMNKKQEKISEGYDPIRTFLSDVENTPQDILGIVFTKESEGPASITINGVNLRLGNTTQSTAFFSNDNLQTATNTVDKGSILYINPYQLGYDIDDNDVIGLEYIGRSIFSVYDTPIVTVDTTYTLSSETILINSVKVN